MDFYVITLTAQFEVEVFPRVPSRLLGHKGDNSKYKPKCVAAYIRLLQHDGCQYALAWMMERPLSFHPANEAYLGIVGALRICLEIGLVLN